MSVSASSVDSGKDTFPMQVATLAFYIQQCCDKKKPPKDTVDQGFSFSLYGLCWKFGSK